jgi:hypothetical protein
MMSVLALGMSRPDSMMVVATSTSYLRSQKILVAYSLAMRRG